MLQAIEVGGALFSMGINYMVANRLISTPETFANLLTFAPNPDPVFKGNKNILDLLPLLHIPKHGNAPQAEPTSVDHLVAALTGAPPPAPAPAPPPLRAPAYPPAHVHQQYPAPQAHQQAQPQPLPQPNQHQQYYPALVYGYVPPPPYYQQPLPPPSPYHPPQRTPGPLQVNVHDPVSLLLATAPPATPRPPHILPSAPTRPTTPSLFLPPIAITNIPSSPPHEIMFIPTYSDIASIFHNVPVIRRSPSHASSPLTQFFHHSADSDCPPPPPPNPHHTPHTPTNILPSQHPTTIATSTVTITKKKRTHSAHQPTDIPTVPPIPAIDEAPPKKKKKKAKKNL